MNIREFITIFSGSNYSASIWDTYASYVLADGGTAESRDCTINNLARLIS